MKIGKENSYLLGFVVSFLLFASTQALVAQTNDVTKVEAPITVLAETILDIAGSDTLCTRYSSTCRVHMVVGFL